MLKEFKGTREEWNKIISNFDFFDYLSLYEWGKFKKRQGWQLKRYTFSRDNKAIYAFQTFYKKIFFIKLVWIPGGILGKIDSNLNLLVSNLKDKLSKFFILSIGFSKKHSIEDALVLKNINFTKINSKRFTNFRMELLLHTNIFDQKKELSKNWRHNLNRAYNKPIRIQNFQSNMIGDFINIYEDMESFKKIKKPYDSKDLKILFEEMKNLIVTKVCIDENNKIISFRSALIFNNFSWDFLAATSKNGRKVYASYLSTWELIKSCVEKKVKFYDMSGINKKTNIGVYNFKKGTNSYEVKKLGLWQYSDNIFLRAIIKIIAKIN